MGWRGGGGVGGGGGAGMCVGGGGGGGRIRYVTLYSLFLVNKINQTEPAVLCY